MANANRARWGVKTAILTFDGTVYAMANGPAGKSETRDAIDVTALSDTVKQFIKGAVKEIGEFTVTLPAGIRRPDGRREACCCDDRRHARERHRPGCDRDRQLPQADRDERQLSEPGRVRRPQGHVRRNVPS